MDVVWSDTRFDLRTYAEKVRDTEQFDRKTQEGEYSINNSASPEAEIGESPGATDVGTVARVQACNQLQMSHGGSSGDKEEKNGKQVDDMETNAQMIQRLRKSLAILKSQLDNDNEATELERQRARDQVERTLLSLEILMNQVKESQKSALRILPQLDDDCKEGTGAQSCGLIRSKIITNNRETPGRSQSAKRRGQSAPRFTSHSPSSRRHRRNRQQPWRPSGPGISGRGRNVYAQNNKRHQSRQIGGEERGDGSSSDLIVRASSTFPSSSCFSSSQTNKRPVASHVFQAPSKVSVSSLQNSLVCRSRMLFTCARYNCLTPVLQPKTKNNRSSSTRVAIKERFPMKRTKVDGVSVVERWMCVPRVLSVV